MPWWQGRNDAYDVVPPASEAMDTKGSDTARLSKVLELEEERGYLPASRGYTTSSTARWARYDPYVVTIDRACNASATARAARAAASLAPWMKRLTAATGAASASFTGVLTEKPGPS